MKLATFEVADSLRVGIVDANRMRVLDLQAAAARQSGHSHAYSSMIALIDAGEVGLDGARELEATAEDDLWYELSTVRLRSPLPEPRQMRDFSVFPGHLTGAPAGMAKLVARLEGIELEASGPDAAIPDVFRRRPIYYKCNHLSVAGHEDDVLWPRYSQYMDYELEFGVVIGKSGADISRERAREHIFGYTIFNDFSARDAQRDEMASRFGPAKGKDFDTGNVLGPWIVTPDELTNPYDLRMQARVNGEVWSDGRSHDMIHNFEDMIAYVSRDETLYAGEFLGSGTIGGGCGMELDRYLEHGDVVELEVEGIGILRNRVLRKDRQQHTA